MKKNIMILALMLPLYLLGQDSAFYKKTIFAFQFSNGDTIVKKELVTYYDSLRNTISSENNFSNAISGDDRLGRAKEKKLVSYIEVDSDSLYMKIDVNAQGDTVNKLIYRYDKDGNRTHYFQIRNKDTLNAQKRIYDSQGNNTELYNKHKDKPYYYLGTEWKYDKKGNYTEAKNYNANNDLVGLYKYENKYKKNKTTITMYSYISNKGYVRQFKTIEIGNIKETHYYISRIAFNYGIRYNYTDGSVNIREYDEDGNLINEVLYDENKNKIAEVIIMEEKVK